MSNGRLQIGKPTAHWTPDSVETVLRKVRGELKGALTPDGFSGPLRAHAHGPVYSGTLTPAASGTLIELRREIWFAHLLILGALFFFVGPLFGVFFIFLYHRSYTQAEARWKGLLDELGVDLEGQEAREMARIRSVSDPCSQGAAAGAPPAFHVRSDVDGAAFILRGQRGSRVVLQVTARGMGVVAGAQLWRADWQTVERVDVEGEWLVISISGRPTVRIDGSAHTGEDLLWLAVYLQSRDEQASSSPEERAAIEASLGALRPHD